MRLEFSFIAFIEFVCYATIYGLLWRSAAAGLCIRNPDSNLGQAMAWIH